MYRVLSRSQSIFLKRPQHTNTNVHVYIINNEYREIILDRSFHFIKYRTYYLRLNNNYFNVVEMKSPIRNKNKKKQVYNRWFSSLRDLIWNDKDKDKRFYFLLSMSVFEILR